MIYGDYDILLGCFVLLLAAYHYVTSKYNYWKVRGVKGPAPLPFVGNFGSIMLRKVLLGEYLKELYDEYKEESFVGIYSIFDPILIVKDPAFIKDILIKDFAVFADRGMTVNEKVDLFATNLFTIEGKRWRPLRAKLSPTFSSGKLKDMFYLLAQCSDNFGRYLDRLVSQNNIVDCRTITSKFTSDTIGTCMFGIELNSLNDEECEFLRMAKKFVEPSTRMVLRDRIRYMLPRLYGLIGRYLTYREVNEYFLRTVIDVIEYRWNHNVIKHDFVDILQDLRKHPEKLPELELTDNVIVAQAIAFFIGGYFASSVTMGHILYELAMNQQMQERLRAEIAGALEKTDGAMEYESIREMNYLDAIFKEVLRRYPPVTHIMRQSLESYTFAGTQLRIPKGQQIWIPVYPAHLDPEIYPDPKVFDPERFMSDNGGSMSYLPFGEGPRNCIGARFAAFQTKVGIVEIMKSFKVDACEETSFEYGNQTRLFALSPKSTCLKFTKIGRE